MVVLGDVFVGILLLTHTYNKATYKENNKTVQICFGLQVLCFHSMFVWPIVGPVAKEHRVYEAAVPILVRN